MSSALLAQKEEYRYRISSTGESSSQYGNCDVCGGHCSEVYYQTEERHYSFIHEGRAFGGWTGNKCNNHFGHKECLEGKQRDHSTNLC
jgi:hypothetical protein